MIPIVKTEEPIVLKPEEMATFAAFDKYLSKYGLGIICAKCQTSLAGRNATVDQVFSVRCSCREFKCDNPRTNVH